MNAGLWLQPTIRQALQQGSINTGLSTMESISWSVRKISKKAEGGRPERNEKAWNGSRMQAWRWVEQPEPAGEKAGFRGQLQFIGMISRSCRATITPPLTDGPLFSIDSGESMPNTRRFSRVRCIEKSVVKTDSGSHDVVLKDISLKGALIEHGNDLPAREGDRWKLFFQLDQTDIILEFEAEVIHLRDNLAGVKFIEMDLDTMIHLRSLMEARTVNPDQVRHELEFLTEDE